MPDLWIFRSWNTACAHLPSLEVEEICRQFAGQLQVRSVHPHSPAERRWVLVFAGESYAIFDIEEVFIFYYRADRPKLAGG